MNQTELATALTDLSAQLEKAYRELTAQIAALEEAIRNAGNVTPEVQAALNAVKAKAQTLDDINPDVFGS